jgi:hypothetical protein
MYKQTWCQPNSSISPSKTRASASQVRVRVARSHLGFANSYPACRLCFMALINKLQTASTTVVSPPNFFTASSTVGHNVMTITTAGCLSPAASVPCRGRQTSSMGSELERQDQSNESK